MCLETAIAVMSSLYPIRVASLFMLHLQASLMVCLLFGKLHRLYELVMMFIGMNRLNKHQYYSQGRKFLESYTATLRECIIV